MGHCSPSVHPPEFLRAGDYRAACEPVEESVCAFVFSGIPRILDDPQVCQAAIRHMAELVCEVLGDVDLCI